jgi:hypothetical protein
MKPIVLIFSRSRCGSTLLRRALNSHSECRIGSEIFHQGDHSRKWFNHKIFPNVPIWTEAKSRKEYLYDLRNLEDNPKHIGAKIIKEQAPEEFFQWAIDNPDITTIRCDRHPLSAYVSHEQSKKDGFWNKDIQNKGMSGKVTEKPPETTIELNLQEFKKYLDETIRFNCLTNKVDLIVPYHQLTFDFDLGVKKLFDDLELKYEDIGGPEMKKIRSWSIINRISNYNDIKNLLPLSHPLMEKFPLI